MPSDRLTRAAAELAEALLEAIHEQPAAPPALLSIAEACAQMGLSRAGLYAAMSRGEIRSLKVGRRRFVPASAIEELSSEQGNAHTFDGAGSRRGVAHRSQQARSRGPV